MGDHIPVTILLGGDHACIQSMAVPYLPGLFDPSFGLIWYLRAQLVIFMGGVQKQSTGTDAVLPYSLASFLCILQYLPGGLKDVVVFLGLPPIEVDFSLLSCSVLQWQGWGVLGSLHFFARDAR